MQHVDIAIVGGGIVGLTLAAALKHSELSIAIVDKAVCYQTLDEKPTARVSAINQANIKALQQFDVWSHLQQDRANPYTDMHVWDKDSFGDIHFSCDEMGSDALGVIVENQALVNALSKSVQVSLLIEFQVFTYSCFQFSPRQINNLLKRRSGSSRIMVSFSPTYLSTPTECIAV